MTGQENATSGKPAHAAADMGQQLCLLSMRTVQIA
jgi:hypothetical protein